MSPGPRRDAGDALRQELRRGALVLAVLASFRREQFGAEALGALAEAGVEIEAGALYPMLRRLEHQGLLASERRTEDGRQKRFYVTTPAGAELLSVLVDELESMTRALKSLAEQADDHD